MCFLYKIEGMEDCYCAKCFEEIKENKTMSKNEELKEVARPLVEYIRKNYHPHVTVIVDSMHAEVLEGVAVAKYEWEGEYGDFKNEVM